ncbi:ribonuclease HIII [[Mycoplasma] falconis]|uniref:Ribonuclease n=1 Tax=[Mycoplasma] falconis TaxID=92403 RepID=A0A501XB15_9BACT|nr:ribonuclease HIII [[Mycoplasma] falconis]TPE57741.1 ribonuclease HIII [[Mycoplasma] falconis]
MTNIDYDLLIGADETGVGDYFTPIVFVACYVPKENIEKVKELGVKDSKKLSDIKIKAIYPELLNLVKYKKSILTQKGYNKLIESKINNNEIKTLLHFQTINSLQDKENLKGLNIIIDQYTQNEGILEKHIVKLSNLFAEKHGWSKPLSNIYLETKAEDKSIAVACASIIARKILLDLIGKQNHEWSFEFPLGASTKVDEAAAKFINKYGLEKLKDVAKISFKTTQKAKLLSMKN